MKTAVYKFLMLAILFVHLGAPAQAVVMDLAKTSESKASHHCMQHKQETGQFQVSKAGCCQQDKTDCDGPNCQQCKTCGAIAMLISLHRQAVTPMLPATSLVYVSEYLQDVTPQNLYRPPIYPTL
jgi:hypothetical protein